MFPLPIAQRSGLFGSNCGWSPPGSMLPTIANSPMMGVLGDDPTYHLYCWNIGLPLGGRSTVSHIALVVSLFKEWGKRHVSKHSLPSSRKTPLPLCGMQHPCCTHSLHWNCLLTLGTALETIFFGSSYHSVLVQVEEYCEEMGEGARVLLVPSYRDAHHDCIFPQVKEHFNAKTGFSSCFD